MSDAVKNINGGYTSSSKIPYSKMSHGLTSGSIGKPININGALAIASDNVIGLLESITDANNLMIITDGIFTKTSHGLTIGKAYAVSNATAGNVVTVDSLVGIGGSPIFWVIDADTLLIQSCFQTNALTSDVTISVAVADSIATVQAKINLVPKNLNGHVLTVSFGSYTTYSYGGGVDGFVFNGFYGGSIIFTGQGTANTYITVTAMGGGSSYGLISFVNCACTCTAQNFRIVYNAATSVNGVSFNNCPRGIVTSVSFYGNSVSPAYSYIGVAASYGLVTCYDLLISTMYFAIYAQNLGKIYCNVISGSGNGIGYGAAGGHIVGYSPNCSLTASTLEYTSAGGIISLTA
jgi:hypothetical protein